MYLLKDLSSSFVWHYASDKTWAGSRRSSRSVLLISETGLAIPFENGSCQMPLSPLRSCVWFLAGLKGQRGTIFKK